MLSIENIDVSYGKVQVLYDISLRVDKGTVCALFGRNGAGKATLLKSYVGLLPISNGITRFQGKDITNMEPSKICSRGVGFVFQERSVFPTLSVLEHFKLSTVNTFGARSLDRVVKEVVDLFPDIEKLLDRKGAALSGGEARMVELAAAIIRRPRLLLLDEPLAGLSPMNVHRLFNRLRELKEEMTTFVAEQNIRTALESADRFFIIREGALIYQDTVKDVSQGERVVKDHILG